MTTRTSDRLLRFTFATGIGLWVGGATTLQAILARARRGGDPTWVLQLTDDVVWSIRRLFVPAGVAGVAAGLALAARDERTGLGDARVLAPLGLYASIAVLGATWSLPEYERLARLAGQRGPDDPDLHRRLLRAAWVNRVELGLVYAALLSLAAPPRG